MSTYTINDFLYTSIYLSIPDYIFIFTTIYLFVKNRYKGLFNRKILIWTNSFSVKFSTCLFTSIIYATYPIIFISHTEKIVFIYFLNSFSWLLLTILSYYEFRRKIPQSWIGLKANWLITSILSMVKLLLFIIKADNHIKKPNGPYIIFTCLILILNIISFILSFQKRNDYKDNFLKDVEIDINFLNDIDHKYQKDSKTVYMLDNEKWDRDRNFDEDNRNIGKESNVNTNKESISNIKSFGNINEAYMSEKTKKSFYEDYSSSIVNIQNYNKSTLENTYFCIDMTINQVFNRKFSNEEAIKVNNDKSYKLRFNITMEILNDLNSYVNYSQITNQTKSFKNNNEKLKNTIHHTEVLPIEEIISFNNSIISQYKYELYDNGYNELYKSSIFLEKLIVSYKKEMKTQKNISSLSLNHIENESSIEMLMNLYLELSSKFNFFALGLFKLLGFTKGYALINKEILLNYDSDAELSKSKFKSNQTQMENLTQTKIIIKKNLVNMSMNINENENIKSMEKSDSLTSEVNKSKFDENLLSNNTYNMYIFMEFISIIMTNSNNFNTKILKIKNENNNYVLNIQYNIKQINGCYYLKQSKKIKEINLTSILQKSKLHSEKTSSDMYSYRQLLSLHNQIDDFYNNILKYPDYSNYSHIPHKRIYKRLSKYMNQMTQDLFFLFSKIGFEFDIFKFLLIESGYFKLNLVENLPSLINRIYSFIHKDQFVNNENNDVISKNNLFHRVYEYLNEEATYLITDCTYKITNSNKKSLLDTNENKKEVITNDEIEIVLLRENICKVNGKVFESKISFKMKKFMKIIKDLTKLKFSYMNSILDNIYMEFELLEVNITNIQSLKSSSSNRNELRNSILIDSKEIIQNNEEISNRLNIIKVLIQHLHRPKCFYLLFSSEMRDLFEVNKMFHCSYQDMNSSSQEHSNDNSNCSIKNKDNLVTYSNSLSEFNSQYQSRESSLISGLTKKK